MGRIPGTRLECDTCGHEMQIGEFPFCHGDPSQHVRQTNSVIGDEIDIWIKNGLCNDDATPRRWRSRQALKDEAARRGLENRVRHVGKPGSDKSPFTSKWY